MSQNPKKEKDPESDIYSLEYLIDFSLQHDIHGLGRIKSIDDEQNTCKIVFDDGNEFELLATSLEQLTFPWVIDQDLLKKICATYTKEMDEMCRCKDELERELAEIKQQLDENAETKQKLNVEHNRLLFDIEFSKASVTDQKHNVH